MKSKEYWLSVLGVFIYYISQIDDIMKNNLVYALQQLQRYDNGLFQGNLAVHEGGISPRFFMDILVSSCLTFNGGDYANVALILEYFSAFILSVATVDIVYNLFDKRRFFFISILSYCLANSVLNGLPGWGSFELIALGLGNAYAFAMLAIARVIRSNENIDQSWVLLAISGLFHVHEGIYGGFICISIYVIRMIYNRGKINIKKHSTFIIFAGVMIFSAVIGIKVNASSVLSAKEFTDIYAVYRYPHHLFPEVWRSGVIIIHFLCLILSSAFTLFTIHKYSLFRFKAVVCIILFYIILWLGIIGIEEYVITINPSSLIISMFITKFLRYIAILSVFAVLYCADKWIEDQKLTIGYGSIFLMMLISLFLYNSKVTYEGMFWISVISGHVLYLEDKIKSNILALFCVVILLFVYVGKDRIWTYDAGFKWYEASAHVKKSIGNDLYYLAEEFKNKTKNNEYIIVDPNNIKSTWFQFISKRNVYVSFKAVPTSHSQTKEWYDRMMETEHLLKKDVSDIINIMKKHSIKYILVDRRSYKKFENQSSFKQFLKSKNDEFRVYKILKG